MVAGILAYRLCSAANKNGYYSMLVFVDESGDTGLKLDSGSSKYFTVCLVAFEDNEEAEAVDMRIGLLRRELRLPDSYEFHFQSNSDNVRQALLTAVSPYSFYYFGFVVNKAQLHGEGFHSKTSFYKYACGMIFEHAKPYLSDANVKIDGSGDQSFKRELCAYLKRRINPKDGACHIKKVTAPDSRGNNLIQLADMVSGAVARSYATDKANASVYRDIIKHLEILVKFWPE